MRVDDGAVRASFHLADGLPHATVTGLAQAADGSLWVATAGGLVRLAGGRSTVEGVPTVLQRTPIRALALDPSGGLGPERWAPVSIASPADLLAATDRALYRAKNLGRNRVATDSDASTTS